MRKAAWVRPGQVCSATFFNALQAAAKAEFKCSHPLRGSPLFTWELANKLSANRRPADKPPQTPACLFNISPQPRHAALEQTPIHLDLLLTHALDLQ